MGRWTATGGPGLQRNQAWSLSEPWEKVLVCRQLMHFCHFLPTGLV